MLEYYTPHFITAVSLFLSVYLHAKPGSVYWKASLISGLITAALATLVIFALHDNYLQLVEPISLFDHTSLIVTVAALGFGYGFVMALLVGYVLIFAPSFFD
ncbi:hypothetical protein [Arenicella xantha]|uniref:Trichothecene efflux pump TRI12 n=1 Tax=Arenicella xantha TaxID=644221 RepID=A0A395JK08_9GAMM|nr:hypothetical protein [Arenicella xantha]RBP50859.1 trichothecene efflux pump TRI12 [Arenicella xantha]